MKRSAMAIDLLPVLEHGNSPLRCGNVTEGDVVGPHPIDSKPDIRRSTDYRKAA